jgi:multidrug efflux pump subunit AcrB
MALRCLSAIKKSPGFEDVTSDQQNQGLQALLTYDRPTAARLGVTPQLMDRTLYDARSARLRSRRSTVSSISTTW